MDTPTNPAPSVRDGEEVEKAARACYGVTCEAIRPSFKKWPGGWTPEPWDGLKEIERELHRNYARAVLASASVPDQSGVGGNVGEETGASSTTTGLLPDGPTASRSSGFAAAIPSRGWQDIGKLRPQTKAMLGRWCRCGDNEDGSEHWYWQQASGRYFDYLGERHWCLDGYVFEDGPFYGATPTHFLPIDPAPPRPSALGTEAHSAETETGSVEDEGPASTEATP